MSSAIQGSSTRVVIVLAGQSDWDEWYEVTKTAAQALDVWDYINPATAKDQLPELTEPVKPEPKDVDPAKATLSALDPTGRDIYRILYQQYLHDLGDYKKQKKALQTFKVRIQESVSRGIISYTFNCDTPYDMMVKLKTRFAPTDETREQEMLVRYRKLQKPPRTKNLESWLHEWEKTYYEASQMKLPDVDGHRAVKDFIHSLCETDPGFYTYWTHHIRNIRVYPTLDELINNFRRHLQQDGDPKTSNHGAFPATFQDETVDTTTVAERTQSSKGTGVATGIEKKKKDCLCGETHRFKDCPYIVEAVRKPGWSPDKDVQKAVDQKIQGNAKLKGIVAKLRKDQSSTKDHDQGYTPAIDTPSPHRYPSTLATPRSPGTSLSDQLDCYYGHACRWA